MSAALGVLALPILAAVAAGLPRVLRGPGRSDQLLAVQLLCTGGIAVLLVLGVATAEPALLDVALVLALLGAFAAVAFVLAAQRLEMPAAERPGTPAAERPGSPGAGRPGL